MCNNKYYILIIYLDFPVAITPTYLWCKVLECVRRFIPLHDYKSCRDIFKMLLEVVKRIPHAHSSYPAQLETEVFCNVNKTNGKHKLLASEYSSGDNSLTEEPTQGGNSAGYISFNFYLRLCSIKNKSEI